MTQNKALTFEKFCQKQQREMKCIFPSSEDCFKCEIRQKNREIEELKKKLEDAVKIMKSMAPFSGDDDLHDFLKRNKL